MKFSYSVALHFQWEKDLREKTIPVVNDMAFEECHWTTGAKYTSKQTLNGIHLNWEKFQCWRIYVYFSYTQTRTNLFRYKDIENVLNV